MARIITLRDIAADDLSGAQKFFVYNGLDACITREVWDVLRPRCTTEQERIYKFQMAMQAPAMQMMLRGVRVDNAGRLRAIAQLEADYVDVVRKVNLEVAPVWDATELETGQCPKGKRHTWPRSVPDAERTCAACGAPRVKPAAFNPNSATQASHLFYNRLGVPPQTNKLGAISTDDEVLERIGRKWPRHKSVVDLLLLARGIRKQIGVLQSNVSADGRMRSTFVVGGAWTGRWSSTKSPYGEGTNLQNIAEKLRFIFVADIGKEMFYADLEQAESCVVAHLAGDENYIAAHNTGDVHTYVSRLLWPDLPWTGNLLDDRKVADETHPVWDPDHSYRYNAKRIQHGSNYLLSAVGVARIAHIPQAASREAQERYFDAFPGIKQYHYTTVAELKQAAVLTSPAGRRCQFFGRVWDDHTMKQAVAFRPQSLVGDILNSIMWRVWHELDPQRVELLAQVHDAILGQYASADTTAPQAVLDAMRVPVPIYGIDGKTRSMVIPVDLKHGQNWGKRSAANPGGLK